MHVSPPEESECCRKTVKGLFYFWPPCHLGEKFSMESKSKDLTVGIPWKYPKFVEDEIESHKAQYAILLLKGT